MNKISKLVKTASVKKAVEKAPIAMLIGVVGLTIFEVAKTIGYKAACNDLNETHEHLVNRCKESIDSLSKEYENRLDAITAEYERALEEEKPEYIFREVMEDIFQDFTKEEVDEIKEVIKKFKRSIL